MDQIRFCAALPPIQSAVTVSGNGDGLRIKLDVPGSDMLQALRMLALSGQAFVVTITPVVEAEGQP